MPNSPKILIFIDWFTPGFKAGGPIKSVTNIINSLSTQFDFYIITSDRDINENSSYQNIELNAWLKKENYSIIYLTPDVRDKWINNHLKEVSYDNYYFNSLFSKYFTLKPLLLLNKLSSKKVIIAPRGMLGKGALSIKPIKKKIFIQIAKLLGYYKNVIWHATNPEEKNDIIINFGKDCAVKIASNISHCIIIKKEITKVKNELKLIFFSRISPKKNLLYTLEILKDIPNVSLTIYGSIEDDDYWKRCSDFIQANNLNVKYKGELIPAKVISTLSNYHFFILPTLHENYGHVIVEALTAGCGLIISKNTPWQQLKLKGIGWDIKLDDKNDFIVTIKNCIAMEQQEYNIIRNNCYNFVTNEINSEQEIENTKKLFS